jgi:acyl-CoA synthetase (AMP-forming)/AMP-acid ligase II
VSLSENIRRTLASGWPHAFETEAGWFSWDQVAAIAERLDQAFADMGLPRHTPIGLIGRNRVWSASALLGILAGERCVAPINPFQAEAMLLEDVDRLELAAVIGEPEDFASGALEAAARRKGIGAIVLEGPAADQVRSLVQASRSPAPDGGQIALLIPTSGTTGVPKRVPIRFDSLAAANAEAEAVGADYGETPGPGQLKPPLIQYSPLVHITGSLCVSRCGSEGRSLVLLEKFTAEGWVDAVERNRIRVAGLPPTMMRMVLTLNPPPERLASLTGVWSGSSPVDMEVVKRFEARYGVVVMGNYGATEYCGTVASGSLADRRRFGDAKDGAVGRVRRNVADFRVLDPDTGGDAALGETGVLELRVHRMGPEWMRTSDLVSIDADDFLFVRGRADDAINRGGFKITPSVISDALRRHPAVEDVAVVGVSDLRLGEAPVAAVEVKPGADDLTSEALMAFARQHLIAYQVPVAIRIVGRLPRTPSMKIDKARVKALFASPAPD